MNQKATLNIEDFGARGGGDLLNTKPIQQAINQCPHDGTVVIPRGIFKTGALFLKSHMKLHLDEGATLLGSEFAEDYPPLTCRFQGNHAVCHASLLNAGELEGEGVESLTISGLGRIDGNGSELLHAELNAKQGERGRVICIRQGRNISIQDVTVCHSAFWCLHLIYCQNVTIRNARIRTESDESGHFYPGIYNGDGLDIDSCCNVLVENCEFATQDDCIAIKSGRDAEGRRVAKPSQNIHIRKCRFRRGFGVALGSEMSGGIRNILVEECHFDDTACAALIKTPRPRGGFVENVIFRDIVHQNHSYPDCEWFRGSVCVDVFYSHTEFDPTTEYSLDEETPQVSNIVFERIHTMNSQGHAVYLCGFAQHPLERITLREISGEGRPPFYACNVKNLQHDSVNLKNFQFD